MKNIFVTQIKERDWVDGVFLVGDKTLALAKNGKPYMTLRLADRSGEVEGRVWDRVDELAATFEKNDFIAIKAKASVYLGKMQLVIQELEPVPEAEIDLADFLPVSDRPVAEMRAELVERVAALGNPHLKALMEAFIKDREFMSRYVAAPAAKSMHHVFLGGLLEHSLAVAALADDVSRRYPGIDRDLLIVGALLHDIGKVAELRYERSFDYSDEGKLIGHIVMGVEMIGEKIQGLPGFPSRLAMILKHLLLSHHGQYEYGSPKRPKTLEAVVLNFIDDLDSKINGVSAHIAKEPDREGSWTSYHRLYDRYFFRDGSSRASSAPAPVAAQQETVAAPPPSRPVASERPKAPEGNRGREQTKRGFGFTLGDQLKGKSLDLFGEDSGRER
ncbi:3'-5' exoribonuclease YhaM family protein [Trichloromonas sp.]|uniref:3'-5' exoribonuclease YhaM family protein n=1 Tax=Trichloromonas sp. TaxID=3069249 RepID=UPI002A44D5C9|nr:HD domain-containing protein [Trichloromonas sp.]